MNLDAIVWLNITSEMYGEFYSFSCNTQINTEAVKCLF